MTTDAIAKATSLFMRMVEMRDTALKLVGEAKFRDKVAEYRPYIEAKTAKGATIAEAALELCELAKRNGGSDFMILWITATAVELSYEAKVKIDHGPV